MYLNRYKNKYVLYSIYQYSIKYSIVYSIVVVIVVAYSTYEELLDVRSTSCTLILLTLPWSRGSGGSTVAVVEQYVSDK